MHAHGDASDELKMQGSMTGSNAELVFVSSGLSRTCKRNVSKSEKNVG